MQEEFRAQLRANTGYPTFHLVVRAGVVLGYMVAVALAIAAFVGMRDSLGQGLALLFAAMVSIVLTHLFKELSLMMADLADAAVFTAAQSAADGERDAANTDW